MLPPALGSSPNIVASLSRAFTREIENLPTRYLREFYKIKVEDDIEALPSPDSPGFKAKYKRVSRELRKLEAANNGSTAAYEHVLSLAYGRKGKLRRELMEPLFSDPSAPLPPPIIPPVESSRPPVYPPEITALLGSSLSRHGSSTRSAKQLQNPPTLPNRADPKSADAEILGPLSKRREVNMRWRFFKEETAKIRPPIEVSRVHIIQGSTSLGDPAGTGDVERTDAMGAQQPTPPLVGFQGITVLRDLESIASPNPNPPKRGANSANNIPSTSTVNRFIRRQHRKVLGKIPILTYLEHPNCQVGKYQVSLSALANADSLNRLASTVPMADETDLAWLMLPAPPQEPRVDVGSPSSQEPKGKVELVTDTMQMVDQNPRVSGKLKLKALPRLQQSNSMDGDDPPDELHHGSKGGPLGPKAEQKAEAREQPEAKRKSQVVQDSQVRTKPTRAGPPRSAWTDEPTNQLKHRARDGPQRDFGHSGDSERPRVSDETASKGRQMEVPFSS